MIARESKDFLNFLPSYSTFIKIEIFEKERYFPKQLDKNIQVSMFKDKRDHNSE